MINSQDDMNYVGKMKKFSSILMITIILSAFLWAMPMQAVASVENFYNAYEAESNNISYSHPIRQYDSLMAIDESTNSKYIENTEYKKAMREFVKSTNELAVISNELKEALENKDVSQELTIRYENAVEDLFTHYIEVRVSLDNVTLLFERLVSEDRISELILKRHLDFIEEFDLKSQELLTLMGKYEEYNTQINPNNLQEKNIQVPSLEKIEKIDHILNNASSNHDVFYPTDLPHRPSDLKPPAPKVSNIDGLTIKKTAALEISQDPSDYLDTSIYSKIHNNSEIEHLAWSLDHDPVQIFYYVKNNMDYEPYFGPMAGPEWTLKQKGGNSFDQATLLINLYRESGIPARYVYGTVDIPVEDFTRWVRVKNATLAANMLASSGIPTTTIGSGDNIISIRVEHTWVEAYLPYQDFRGQLRSETGYNWIPLDPSFKTYTYVEGMESSVNITWASDFSNDTLNTSTYNETEGWITGINETFVIEEMSDYTNEMLEDILADPELSNQSFKQLFGYWELNGEESNFLPSTLPYEITTVLDVYSKIPDKYYHKITFKINSIDYTASSSELAGKRVTISFIPATSADEQLIEDAGGILNVTPYVVNMKPVLMIDGKTVAEGSPIRLGNTLTFTTEFANEYLSDLSSVINTFTVGAYYAIIFNLGKVPLHLVDEHTANLKITNYRLSTNETVQKDDVIGELLYLHGIMYFHQNDFLLEPLSDKIRWYRPTPSQAITFMDLKVWYDWFGNPVDLDAGGMTIDVDRNVIASVGENINTSISFMFTSGIIGSSLEHEIFEQVYELESVSTIRILEEANARGIPIYTINQTNLYDILPVLQLPDYVKNWIKSDVMAGRIVIVPEQKLEIKEWNGSGWVVIDPATGAGGYYICGIAGVVAGGTIADKIPLWFGWLINAGGMLSGKLGWLGKIAGIFGWILTAIDALNLIYYKAIGELTWAELTALSLFFGLKVALWIGVSFLVVAGFAAGMLSGIIAALVFVSIALMFNWVYSLAFKEMTQNVMRILAELSRRVKHGLFSVAQAKPQQPLAYYIPPSYKSSNPTDPITKGKQWLTNAQTPEGYWGYISDVKHTSFVTMVLSEQGYDVSNAITCIVEHQKPDGSFGNLESTCFAVWALSKAGIANNNGTNYISSAQDPDGSWGDHLNTSFAIIALNISGISISNDTINYLLDTQNTDGGWGTPSQTFDTALAIKALNLTGVGAKENETKKGMAWLEYHQHTDGGWDYEDSSALALDVLLLNSSWNSTSAVQWLSDQKNPDHGWGIYRSQAYVTALVVNSLLMVDPGLTSNGTQWLLDNQNPDGGWGFSKDYSSGFLRDTALAGEVLLSNSAANWVAAQQNPDGGLENADHTSRMVLFLSDMGYDITNGTDWLINYQNQDGGWGLRMNYTSSSWETALAVKALSSQYYQTPEINNGLNWLLNNQNPDDGWGINISDVYITSIVIDSFLSAGIAPAQIKLQDASDWLKSQSPNCTSDVAVRLLILNDMELLDSDMKNESIQWLLDNQNEDGGWGPLKNRTSTPYHTALAIKALEVFYQNNYSFILSSGWNLISVPLNLTSWELGEEAVVGDPLNVTPKNSIISIYRYDAAAGQFEMCDHFDDWGWYPATGSESFTELEPGRGYWVMADQDCVLTFNGTGPADLDITLNEDWNLVGWYSMSEALLGEEAMVENPLNVTPENSLTSIYRYNATAGSFEKCDHFNDWGWWPATGSEKFTRLEPGRGYWVMAVNDCEWQYRL